MLTYWEKYIPLNNDYYFEYLQSDLSQKMYLLDDGYQSEWSLKSQVKINMTVVLDSSSHFLRSSCFCDLGNGLLFVCLFIYYHLFIY